MEQRLENSEYLKSRSRKSRNLVKHFVFAIKTDEMFLVDKLFSYRFH